MKTLLKLKAWQIFMLLFGLPIIVSFLPRKYSDPLGIVFNLLSEVTLFLWLYAIYSLLPKKVNKIAGVNDKAIKIHMIILFTLTIGLGIMAIFMRERVFDYFGIFVLFAMYGIFVVTSIVKRAAKAITSIELKRDASFFESINNFVLLILTPLGIWFVQPKVRKYYLE